MSSLSDVQSVEDALNSGAVDYLFKPFDPVELERKVSFYFSRYYGNHKNVLILDDDTGMLKMIRNILHKNRFRVMVSSSSDEALSIAMQFKPDLIVTDYEMPGNGGWKFCRSLKQNSQTAEIPVVMISATFDELAMKRSRVLQVDGFVPKPFSPSSLLNSINMVLLQHDMQRQEKLSSELEKELTIGKEIQAGLMPASDIVVGGRLSISARWIPARYLGGDFFFVHEYSEHKVLVTVADVSGKGLSAALLATALQASLKTAVTFSDSPGVLLSSLNTYFLQDSSFEGFFLTAFLALIELDKNSIRYASAGHNKMLLQRGDGELKELSSQNIPCGFYEDEVYQELSDTFVPGDYLVLYSDGVTEAFNEKQEMYGLERLKSCLSEQNHRIAEKKLKNVMSSVQNFIGNAEAADDITLIVCGESVSS
jgi:sigma-B regulation protein RsbU (phosphoserine phosphatase)